MLGVGRSRQKDYTFGFGGDIAGVLDGEAVAAAVKIEGFAGVGSHGVCYPCLMKEGKRAAGRKFLNDGRIDIARPALFN